MKRHPIQLVRQSTRSQNAKIRERVREFNRTAAILEDYINGKMALAPDDSFGNFTHVLLAKELGLDAELVCSALASVDGGSNGITIVKGDIDRALKRNPS